MTAVGYTGGDPNKVDVAGDTMTGPLVLPGDPVSDLQASTKSYVDAHAGGGGSTPGNIVISEMSFGQVSGTGVSGLYSRADHTHGSPSVSPLPLPMIAAPAATAGINKLYAVNDQGFAGLRSLGPNGNEFDLYHDTWDVVRNETGSPIVRGSAVAFVGMHSDGVTPLIAPARADTLATLPVIGLVQADIANNGFGRVIVDGVLDPINTGSYGLRDTLYLSPTVAGGLTNVRPSAPNYVQVVGFVARVQAITGRIHVELQQPIMQTAQLAPVVALTDAVTIATDASLSRSFTVTLGGNRTLGNPTNPVDGAMVLWAIRQDATGSRTLALDTKFRLTSAVTTVVLSTVAGKTDYLGARYNLADDKWDVLAFTKAA